MLISFNTALFLAFAVFYIPATFAQGLPKKGSNLSNPSLSKYKGSWISINGTDTIRMKLKVENVSIQHGLDIHADALVGYVSIKHGNQLIYDNLKNFASSYKDKAYSIFAGLDQKSDTISGTLVDEPKIKFYDIKIIRKDNRNLEIVLGRDKVLKSGTPTKSGRTFPSNMIFRREKE
ncbi:DUF6705 family protein [Pedobacter sp. KLB.chiD]|uniref:DUF6705 family protein n=1 Tax=Pedobacter sp. KLB.chiD TaxID=3387402 RepID=UPI00399BA250